MKLGSLRKGNPTTSRFSSFENLVRSVKTGNKRRPMGLRRKVTSGDLIEQELHEMDQDDGLEPEEGI